MKNALKVLLVLIVAVIVLVSGFAIYTMETSYRASAEALETLTGSEDVIVNEDGYISFLPVDSDKKIGFIYYPGGKVQPEAYAPYAAAFAETGIATYIAKMPINLAILGPNEADKIIESNEDAIDYWIIGGHSLGGAVASKYAYDNQDKIDGLVMLGAYPMESADFNGSDMNIIMINGTSDSIVNRENLLDSAKLLSERAEQVEIEGANHSQFGYYGFQEGDAESEISYDEQLNRVVNEVVDWVGNISE